MLNGDLMTSIMSTGKRHSSVEGKLERSMLRGSDNQGSNSMFDNRSISEIANYYPQNRPGLENLRNGSYTTVGAHEIQSLASSKESHERPLVVAESQKRINLPSLAAQNIEISTNPSSMRKEKRS